MAAMDDPDPPGAPGGKAETRIERRSLHREVTDRLRDMIVEGQMAPGDRVDEGLLCEQFGVSRTPMREALKVLASEGLIELLPNRGARVAEITREEIRELFEAVSGIERIAGELACERMTDRDLSQLRGMHERMERHFRHGQRHEYFRLNQETHNAIVRLAGNSILAATHANLMARVRRARYFAILSQERWEESVNEHAQILEAFEARDAALAGSLIRSHVQKTGAIVGHTYDSKAAGSGRPQLYASE